MPIKNMDCATPLDTTVRQNPLIKEMILFLYQASYAIFNMQQVLNPPVSGRVCNNSIEGYLTAPKVFYRQYMTHEPCWLPALQEPTL